MNTKVIFVEPQTSGNIGFIARSMKNFRLNELITVNPSCEIDDDSKARAMHAEDVLKNSKVFSSLEDALKEVDISVATTSNPKGLTPEKVAEKSSERKGDIGLVFGREDIGLTNDEIRECDLVSYIPASEEYGTLNVSHAAVIFFYEMFRKETEEKERVRRSDKEGLINSFRSLAASEEIGFRNPDNATKMFRDVVSRAFVTPREVRTMKGVFENAKKNL